MEQKLIYPDFSTWRENAIQTKSGITFAPEDFYVLDEHSRRKEFFTWDEAMELEEMILRPNGWRLPTKEEWEKVAEEYKTSAKIRKKLHLGLNGYIRVNEMDEYNRNPDDGAPSGQGRVGYYWSSTNMYGLPDGMYYLYFNDSNVYPGNGLNRGNGHSIHCVALQCTTIILLGFLIPGHSIHHLGKGC